MLTSDQLDSISSSIVDIYTEFESTVIQDIARRLSNLSFDSASWATQRIIESGAVYENVIKELSKLTGKSEKELRSIFNQAGVKSIKFDDSVYKEAGLKPLPLNLSPSMAKVLAAGLDKTRGVMKNLTLTTAINSQQMFIKAADLAYLNISSGTLSYQQAMKNAIKGIGSSGLKISYPSGHKDSLDVAMRRTLLTGVGQTTGNLQWARADEMECDLVQVSAHAGARPSHAAFQGKIFSRSGKSKKYPDFVESTHYGEGDGLGGYNCRHSYFPYFEGISENAYDRETRNEYAKRKVTYNNEKISMYEASQKQRELERTIRMWKRQSESLKVAGLDNTFEAGKVSQYQGLMRDFIAQTKLDRQAIREQI